MNYSLVTVGNPNSGKTSLFNALTGARQQVGNWSGVTVDKKMGEFSAGEHHFKLMDLPGIYSLASQDGSLDEQIASRFAQSQQPDLLLNVIDAANLERSLYLTLQLRELGLPMVVVLNKLDILHKRRIVIDEEMLGKSLGCPVVALSAHNSKQVAAFKQQIQQFIGQPQAALQLDYGHDLEKDLAELETLLAPHHLTSRGRALRLLEEDAVMQETLLPGQHAAASNVVTRAHQGQDIDLQLADIRYGHIHLWASQASQQKGKLTVAQSEWLDRLLLNRWIGIPFFLFVMYLMFMFAIKVGSAFIDFFDIMGGALFVDGVHHLLGLINAPEWLGAIVADGFGVGLQTVATFIPVIGCLYLFLAVLESSGYLARAAFVVDALMRRLGLPGKAFVPMLMGFGCTVPSVMATRTLNSERERLMTSAMAPFMSCGARLPVYALFAVAFFPESGQNLVFGLYLIGIVVAVLTGLLLRSTLLPGKSDSMLMEMPDYEWPRPVNVGIKTWQKLKSFVFGAGKTIVLVVAVLSVLNSLGTDGSFGHQDQESSVLSKVSQMVTPVLHPIGVRDDNWQATVGIVTGIFAKEAVVGTLNSLYAGKSGDEEASEFSLVASFHEAIEAVATNLAEINPSDPMGLAVGELDDQQAAADAQEVDVSTYGNMQTHFDGAAGAFAYLLFVLLYMPCAAAMGALVRETGRQWALFTAAWCNYMAFMCATVFYQVATFAAHPEQSLFWIVSYGLSLVLLWWAGRRHGDIVARKVVTL
ncbi:Fe(2+) transporter permease subunit FeoB [Aeromonas sobria]|uniref:Ferrous iron transport protein B n=1 Tax=Aeromonas sobria TaxID=646 RepID=A0A1S2CZP4_AERSO|nr:MULTISPECIES: Fe(2+) transporter permease subunit FeoB [Aeromonas]ATL92965.1 Fe(2+) transporter permease subunit FeoB [Aeromonas sp. CU5]MBS4686557.1 Fe(2+) transporter permease subunit FeoB [Aeromonas sobria]MCX7127792.1 Fe(2+) transporter permease subunit FeoB [Aeromonas sp.]OHY93121.1 ferrous iron transport protein B [Aeromonas sobria]